MDTQRLAAVLLIAGSATLVLANLIGPSGVYETSDPAERVQIIEGDKSGWNIAQALNGVFILFTTAGFVVLALRLRTVANAWIPTLGAAALVVGAISGAIFLYRQTTDPLGTYSGQYSGFEAVLYWLWLAGLILFGVSFLQAGMPAWLGYLTAGTATIYGIVFLVTGGGFITPFLVSLLGLVIGIILLWKRPLP